MLNYFAAIINLCVAYKYILSSSYMGARFILLFSRKDNQNNNGF
jgi:hypothetical protein